MKQPRAMRHRLILQKPERKENALGEFELGKNASWQDIQPFHADLTPLTALEAERAKQVQSDETHKILVRYSEAVAPQMRFKKEMPNGTNRYFNIKGIVNVDELNAWLDITAVETFGA